MATQSLKSLLIGRRRLSGDVVEQLLVAIRTVELMSFIEFRQRFNQTMGSAVLLSTTFLITLFVLVATGWLSTRFLLFQGVVILLSLLVSWLAIDDFRSTPKLIHGLATMHPLVLLISLASAWVSAPTAWLLFKYSQSIIKDDMSAIENVVVGSKRIPGLTILRDNRALLAYRAYIDCLASSDQFDLCKHLTQLERLGGQLSVRPLGS